jgi:hypothetical protein
MVATIGASVAAVLLGPGCSRKPEQTGPTRALSRRDNPDAATAEGARRFALSGQVVVWRW